MTFGPGPVLVKRARVCVKTTDVRERKPKTHAGRRQVELDTATTAALKAWQERQEAEREEWPGEWPAPSKHLADRPPRRYWWSP